MEEWVNKITFHAQLPPSLQLLSYDDSQKVRINPDDDVRVLLLFVVVVPRVLRYNVVPQGLPRSDQTPVPSTVISTSSSAASTPETERKPMAPPPQPPVVNARKDSQIRRPIPVRPPSVDNIPYQNNHSAVGKRTKAAGLP